MTALIIYLVVLAKSLYASTLGFGLLDEGEYLHIGLRILKGDIPYEDFFTYLPPLYSHWTAFAFQLFGVSAFSPRLLNSLIFAFIPVLIYLITRRFASQIISILVALSFAFMDLSIERLYYYVFPILSVYFYLSFLRNKRIEVGILSGFLLGLTMSFRLDVSLEYFLGLIIAGILYQINNNPRSKWLVESIKLVVIMCAGFFIPVISLFNWLQNYNVFSQFIRSVTLTPSTFFKDQALAFPKLWDIFPKSFSPKDILDSYEAFFVYLIILIYLYALYVLAKNWKSIWKKTPQLPLFLLVAVFTTPYIFSRPDLGHMIKGGIPAFFTSAYLLEKCKSPLKGVLLMIPIILMLSGTAQIFMVSKYFDTKVQSENGTIRTNSQTIENSTLVSSNTIEKALLFIKNNSLPEDQVLLIPHMAGLYFLSNRPSRSYVGNIYNSYIPDEEMFVESLMALKLKVVIYDPTNTQPGFTKTLSSFYPKIHKYIMDNFEVVEKTPEGWLFLKRRTN